MTADCSTCCYLTSPQLTSQNVYNYYQTFLNIPFSPISDLGPGGNSHLRGRSRLGESVWSALNLPPAEDWASKTV